MAPFMNPDLLNLQVCRDVRSLQFILFKQSSEFSPTIGCLNPIKYHQYPMNFYIVTIYVNLEIYHTYLNYIEIHGILMVFDGINVNYTYLNYIFCEFIHYLHQFIGWHLSHQILSIKVRCQCESTHLGLSENVVCLNPMVLLIIIPTKWLFHWEY